MAKSRKDVVQSNYQEVKAQNDDDFDLNTVEDGSEGIPGGTGSFSFDPSEFELDSYGASRTEAQIEKSRAAALQNTKNRIDLIRKWYSDQRKAALKGVYSPTKLREVRTNHAQRMRTARKKIEDYKKAVEVRYAEYKQLYKSRSINQDQFKKVSVWRKANLDSSKAKFNTFRAKVKKNWTTISDRNETRQDKRREKLEVAREAARKEIQAVKREYREKDEKLKLQLRRRPASDGFGEDIFN